jgi:hypothetical protein
MVLAALSMVVVLGGTGLALDVAQATVDHRSAQVAADAAALAGAQQLPGLASSAISAATTQATLNGYTHGGAVTVTVHSPPTSGTHSGDPNSVEVVITEQVETRFVRALNINVVPVQVRAVATTFAGPVPCGLYVLNPTISGALNNVGNANTTVNGGCIQVNSNSPSAVSLTGNSSVTADSNNVVGGCAGGPNTDFNPPCSSGSAAASDPLASVPIPSGVPLGTACGGTPPSCSGTQTISPGVYNSISVSGNNHMTLNPGTYVITGGISNSGNGVITGSGVMLYFACPKATAPYWQDCAVNQAGASLDIVGNGGFTLSAPTSGPYKGLLVFMDRNNTSGIAMKGNGSLSTTGTIYGKSSQVSMSGNGSSFGSLIVANRYRANGNGNSTINYDPDQNYSTSQPGTSSLTE